MDDFLMKSPKELLEIPLEISEIFWKVSWIKIVKINVVSKVLWEAISGGISGSIPVATPLGTSERIPRRITRGISRRTT